MKALVTGATGFLGQHLCARLINEGHDVTAFCRPDSNTKILDQLNLKKVFGDVTDAESIAQAVTGNDLVFHCAAHIVYWGRLKDVQDKINIEGTKNIADACLKTGAKLLHVSSVAAIGIPNDSEPPANENFEFNLKGASFNYHISKKCGEETVREAIAKGLKAVIVNPSSIWGRYGEKYRGFDFVKKMVAGRAATHFTGGICLVHVDDVVDGIVAAVENFRSGERFILGGENLSYRAINEVVLSKLNLNKVLMPISPIMTGAAATVFEAAALFTGQRPRITFATHRNAGKFQYYDSSKAKATLGYSPRNFDAILSECLTFLNEKKLIEKYDSRH